MTTAQQHPVQEQPPAVPRHSDGHVCHSRCSDWHADELPKYQGQQIHRPVPTAPTETSSRMETPVLHAPDGTFQHLDYVNTACMRPPRQKRPAPQPPDQENSH